MCRFTEARLGCPPRSVMEGDYRELSARRGGSPAVVSRGCVFLPSESCDCPTYFDLLIHRVTGDSRISRRDITGLVLCGGKSTRFGSPKSHFVFKGSTLVDRAVRLLSAHVGFMFLGVGDLSRDDWPPGVIVPDLISGKGPLGGLQAGMARLRTDWLLVLAVDLPMVNHADLDRLIEAAGPDDRAVVARDEHGRSHPVCGLYHSLSRQDIDDAIAGSDFSLMGLLSTLKNVQYVTLSSASLRNVNRPDDLV